METDRKSSKLAGGRIRPCKVNRTVPNLEPEAVGHRRPRLSQFAEAEGYLSLLILILLFCTPSLSVLPESYLPPTGLTLLAIGGLFAISGVRHGTGMGRVCAGLSLVILLAFVVVLAMH
jgi:hypothetical protein